jgi:Flp pilus assembly protein TadD
MRIIRLSLLPLCVLVTVFVGFRSPANKNAPESSLIDQRTYDGLKLRAKLQLTNHQFAEALETARRAQTFRNDDHDVCGMITDALVESGDYAGAVQAAQRMIDLRPDSSSYARVSYLRQLHGDTKGAIQAMTLAVKAANPNDPEGVAWYRAQLRLLLTGAKPPHVH